MELLFVCLAAHDSEFRRWPGGVDRRICQTFAASPAEPGELLLGFRRFHEAKLAGESRVTVWGTGLPRREVLAVDDLADACVFVMRHYSGVSFLNIGSGAEITIAEFARLVAEVVDYQGEIIFDPSRPDGMPRKLLDVSKITALGWRAKTPLRDGLRQTYADFLLRTAPECRATSETARDPITIGT